tara:strand:- start:3629 stop:11251 length:7623 start_codon:yes stop_codon:yes gene_type:complete
MSDINKKFSDFQSNDCIVPEPISFIEKEICPTCIKNPNFVLEKNWFDMTEPWLDEATCEYKITVSKEQASGNAVYPDLLTDQELVRYAIRKMLGQFDKLISDETVCSFGGCMATIEEIQKFKGDIHEYKNKVDKYGSMKGGPGEAEGLAATLGMVILGPGALLHPTFSLSGLITKGLLAADRKEKFGLSVTSDENEQLKEYMRVYFGLELSDRLEKLEDLYPTIHPYALEWVTQIQDTYVDPFYNQPKKYLISVPAQNFNRIPEAPVVVSDETEEASLNLKEIIIDGEKLADRLFKLRLTLKSYEYYYSAYQKVDNLIIYEEDDPTNRINYSQARQEIKEFKKDLNKLLKDNDYERVSLWNAPTFGLLKELGKLKIIFDTRDDVPFNIQEKDGNYQVYAKSKKGCTDYELLSGANTLNTYPSILAFLARLEDIIIDITALETKPWLEFTLEYFHPKMTADYGLNAGTATAEQKNALGCLLQDELGVGSGQVVDSLTSKILSYGELFSYEGAKESCREQDQAISGGPVATRDKRIANRREERSRKKAQRQAKDLEKNSKKIYKDALKQYRKAYIIGNLVAKELGLKEKDVTEEMLEEFYGDIAAPGAWIEGLKTAAKQKAQAELDAGEATSPEDDDNPWLEDAKKLANDTIEKEFTIVDELIEAVDTIDDIDDLNSFLAIFGICGLSKLSASVIKCITGGLTLDKVLDIAIKAIFDYMEIRVFERVLAGMPENVRREIDNIIEREFGSGVKLAKVIGFLGEQQPNANLRFIAGDTANEINRVVDYIKSSIVPDIVLTPEQMKEIEGFLDPGGVFWNEDLKVESVYDYETASFVGETPKDKIKNERNLKREIRKLIRRRDRFELNQAREKFESLTSPNKKDIDGELTAARILELEEEYADLSVEFAKLTQIPMPREATVQKQLEKVSARMDKLAGSVETGTGLINELGFEETGGRAPVSAEAERLQQETQEKASQIVEESQEIKRESRRDIRKAKSNRRITKYALNQNQYEQAVKDYKETNIGIKINKLLGAIIIEVVESIFSFTPSTNLFDMLKQFPVPDVLLNVLEGLLKPCPNQSLFHPPPNKFLNTLSLDVCDPSIQITFPKLVLPSISFRYQIGKRVRYIVRKILLDLFTKVLVSILKKILGFLESAICKALEAIGGLAVDALQGKDLEDSFYKALDEAFCEEDDPEFINARGIADSLFKDQAQKASNLISGLAGVDEILNAVSSDEDSLANRQLNERIANAVKTLAPELEALLGSPSKVGYWFKKLGSFLPQADKDRIQKLLEDGVPNLPISSAICLTNEQLEEWNRLREQLLRDKGLSPEDALRQINKLNELTEKALEDFLGMQAALETPGGVLLAPVQELFNPTDPNSNTGGKLPKTSQEDPNGGIDDIYDNAGGIDDCKDNNIIRDQLSEIEKLGRKDASEQEAELLAREIKRGFMGRNGIFSEALRDTSDRSLFFHSLRVKRRLGFPNYVNSQAEWDIKKAEAGFVLNLLMEVGGDEANGVFPETVCLKTRVEAKNEERMSFNVQKKFSETEKAIDENGEPITNNPRFRLTEIALKQIVSDNDKDNEHNISLQFLLDQTENDEIKPKRKRIYYESNLNTTFNSLNPGFFDYYTSVTEKILTTRSVDKKDEIPYTTDYKSELQIDLSEEENQALKSINFNYGSEKPKNIRKEVFKRFMEYNYDQVIGSQDYSDVFDKSYEQFGKAFVNEAYTDPDDSNGLSYGFKFGYTSDDIVEDDFTYYNPDGSTPYNKEEEEKILGVYNNPRIIVLNPETYGGRYSNPPIHILPQPQEGWLQTSSVLFGGKEGCEPKSPAALSFKDIGDRVDKVKRSLNQDPRLAEDPDCVAIRPFNLLLLRESHASLEGTVRATLRIWAAEYFLKGLGVFSNVEYNENNYDLSVSDYISEKMKESMINMGTARSSKRIRIKRTQYWYTFLEQCVQAYQRMIDIDSIKPPPAAVKALEDIYRIQQNYVYPTRKLMREYLVPNIAGGFNLPGGEMDIDDIMDIGYFYHSAAAFRIYGDDMFKSETKDVKIRMKRLFSVKKMRFWTKILSIRIVEKQCRVIMSEMLKSEMRIMSKKYTNSTTQSPTIKDLMSYLIGMKSLFPNSSSNFGTLSYELNKNPGDIPGVSDDITVFTVPDDTKPTFIIEKYIKLKEKSSTEEVPDFIRNRLPEYRGIISPSKFNEFKSNINTDFLVDETGENLQLSDFFGDLDFVYKKNIIDLYKVSEDGTTTAPDLTKLIELNPDLETEINQFYNNYLSGLDNVGFIVQVTQEFLEENEALKPFGVTGETGVYQGIRISLVLPQGAITPWSNEIVSGDLTEEQATIKLEQLKQLSSLSKTLQFSDGTIILPLVSDEVEYMDQDFKSFDAIANYDLVCMVRKLIKNPIYSLMFDKVFSAKMFSSMSAIFCMQNFLAAMGQATEQEVGEANLSIAERNPEHIDPADPDDDFDGTYNKRTKKILRRKFAGLYLSNDLESTRPGGDDDDDDSISFDNPFDNMSLDTLLPKIPWFQRRRIVANPYDMNGEECANPLKDLQ